MPELEVAIAELLSLLAHDLKNPLAATMTNVGFVESFVRELETSTPTDDEIGEAREAMLDARLACDALQRFVSNLEVLSRDLANLRGGEPAPVDLHAIADEVVARHLAAAEARRIRIEVAGDACWAHADRDALVRAADNALANALQHAPAGTRVLVEIARREDDQVSLSFVDSGAVVPPELRAEALSRDGQARLKGRPEGRYGRGLALYAANVGARRAGGRLELGEREGRSVMAVILPRFDDAV